MKKQGYDSYWLLKIQFLGFRYHGWQKQVGVKTVQEMLDKTIRFVCGKETRFKTLASGRTDAMVSVEEIYVELFIDAEINPDTFFQQMNGNLPLDVRLLEISPVDENFQILNAKSQKQYQYLFSYGEKYHPFCAPLMTHVHGDLDLELMSEAARLFEGTHNFKNFCYGSSEHKKIVRSVDESYIEKNTDITASFFPDETFCYKVRASGFMRYQVRLMMGALICVGQKSLKLEELGQALKGEREEEIGFIASASGLRLTETKLRPV